MTHDVAPRNASIINTPPTEVNANTEVMSNSMAARQAAEVQASMAIAKRFPRDEQQSLTRILKACQRRKLAEVSMYAYPRGGEMVTGPSIRLAEVLAQAWGNIDFGMAEISNDNGESIVLARALDLETNTQSSKIFTVKHQRSKKSGPQRLTDPRDIYEHVANLASRRVRSCILAIIPKDIIDEAIEQCQKTLTEGNAKPLADRIRDMVKAFDQKLQVTQAMLEARLGHSIGVTDETELLNLRKIFTSLKDGMSKREDWFDVPGAAPKTIGQVADDVKGKDKPKGKKAAQTPPQDEDEVDTVILPENDGLSLDMLTTIKAVDEYWAEAKAGMVANQLSPDDPEWDEIKSACENRKQQLRAARKKGGQQSLLD